ncbi:MAG: hypothetical protein GF355_08300, partial [Candidatus Eisenbacteria bacterium]|nr:hypothetical protein [Candidatus Eisenbacteria bacterium]
MRCAMQHSIRHMAAPTLAVVTALVFVTVSTGAGASVVRQHYDFPEPVMAPTGAYHEITMNGAWTFAAPGEPMLPMYGVRILLPPGEVITQVEVIPEAWATLDGTYSLAPGQPQTPLSRSESVRPAMPDERIYRSSSPFPGKLREEPHTGLFRGYRVTSFAIHPVEYVPATGVVSYMTGCEIVVTCESSHEALEESARMIRHDEGTLSRLSRVVDNPAAAGDYASIARLTGGSRTLDPDDAYKYIIVSGDPWVGELDPLVAFETERGHKAGVFSRSWILANYSGGVDDQDDIRNFIIDAYQTWDIDYVLLVGDARDDNGIPHRGLYSSTQYGSTDSNIPADMYYGCLDGTWNDDGDNRWGEPNEADLYFEVGVGRACASNTAAVQNFITKTIRYQTAPINEECDEALMAGELLWYDPTWGGDYKDEIKDGSSMHGYTTVGFPPTMNVDTLYDRDYTWSYSELINIMENGMNIVNHLGHCNVTYAMKMTTSDIPSFDNDGTVHSYNFVYSQGCYCGSFDNRDDSGSYTS